MTRLEYLISSALNGFDTLDTDEAVQNAKCELQDALECIRADDAARILSDASEVLDKIAP